MDRDEKQFEYTARQAGKLGGLTTLSRFGITFYRKIGRKGQASFAAKYTTRDRQRWGKLGGRPRKYHRDLGEGGKTDERRHGSPPGRTPSSPATQLYHYPCTEK